MARPLKAEHLGSLLRPVELLNLPWGTPSEVRIPLEKKAIADVVALQEESGIQCLTDGEYSRNLFWGDFAASLEGFSTSPFDKATLRTYLPHVKSMIDRNLNPLLLCTGKIRHTGSSPQLKEFEYLKSVVPPGRIADIKLTIPTPNWNHIVYVDGKAYAEGVYANDEEYFADVAEAYRTELRLLYDAGLRRVQIDDPNLSYFCAPDIREAWSEDHRAKMTPDELLAKYIAFYNQCFQVPSDMHIGIHVCRGNFTDPKYLAAGGYDAIASTLFKELKVNTFYLEYDTEQAGGFEPLQDLPEDKFIVLGVVSTKTAELEDIQKLEERVNLAAEYVAKGNDITKDRALQRLSVSPQCGFASHKMENRLTREDMLKKLSLVRQLADELS